MRLIDALRTGQTGMRRHNDFGQKVTATHSFENIGPSNDACALFADEWGLRAEIFVRFSANNAHLARAKEQALRHLVRTFYAEALTGLVELRSAVFDGDAQAALEIIDRMEKEMGA